MALTEPLDAVEERVLGVLVEKGFTTPEGYPLSLNALVSGCNQKSNRHPSASYTEQTVHEALLRLRMHRIVREVHTAGARVPKFAHAARDVLEVDDQELAILAELLLRGDQTHGELRGRVKRMSPVDSLAALAVLLSKLEDRAMVRSLPPLPGSRAGRVGHLLGIKGDGEVAPQAPAPLPDSPPSAKSPMASFEVTSSSNDETDRSKNNDLANRLDSLEANVTRLTQRLEALERRSDNPEA
ncbi:MAG: DUF480 domain-containing protein [Planctomycetota bacterium]|nr:DUF480 domain-containing protein [Planctomycetota bacterium]